MNILHSILKLKVRYFIPKAFSRHRQFRLSECVWFIFYQTWDRREKKKGNVLGVPLTVVQRCITFISGSEVKSQQSQNTDVASLQIFEKYTKKSIFYKFFRHWIPYGNSRSNKM